MVSESKEYVASSLASISLSELKRLGDDEEYAEDNMLTSNSYMKMRRMKDDAEDQSLKLARENIQVAVDLESDLNVYQETVHPLYEEQQEKVAQLVDKIEQNKNSMSREAAVKVLKTLANEKYKTGKNA